MAAMALAREPHRPDLPEEYERVGALAHQAVYEEVSLEGAFVGVRAAGVVFQSSRWRDVDLSGARLASLALRDCAVLGGNLANFDARSASFQRVVFENCRLTGLRLADATLTDVVFKGCRMDLASFGGCRLQRV